MLVCVGVLSALAFISEAKSEEPVVVKGKILVRYESSLSAQEIEAIEKEFGLQRLNYMSAINTGYYRISGSEDQIDLIERLRKRTGIVLVEEDLLRTQSAAIPNDPLYGQQWYLNSATATHINFQSAIQAFSGTTTIDVAVIDSGILYNHPEFVGKINTTWAYDYVENDTTAQDESGHGTMVASLIGAAHRNGTGMAGVCPNVRFLPLRVFDNAGRLPTATSGILVSALQRAYDANVRIVNLSLAGGGYSAAEFSMYQALNTKGILAVIAAGNGDPNTQIGINNDSSPTYPASYSSPNIISVMATDSSGNPAAFSNYGSASVDIAAPGVGVLVANVRRTTAYNDNFSTGACDWEPSTETWSSPWTRNYRSFNGSFAPYNRAGIYKYFNFTGKKGLRAELSGDFYLGFGDYLQLELWDGTTWNYVDDIVLPGDSAFSVSLDISAFDGQVGYARIMLYCDVYEYGAPYTRYAEIDTIEITEVAVNSVSEPEYLNDEGTSLSAPLVAGTAALLLSQNPTLQVSALKAAILSTATTRSSLSGKSVTGGILNVSAALAAAQPKLAQTISFSALPTKTYADSSFSLTGFASSGLPLSYFSSNTSVATVSGSVVTIVGVGSTTITASQTGNSSYNAATSASQTLTVNKAAQTITFGALSSKTYGDSSFSITGSASSGLPLSYFSSNTSVATVSGSVVTIVGVGSTTITASQSGNSSFNSATSVSQTLTVNKVGQTISFTTLPAKTYGDSAFALTGSSTSGLSVSYSSSNPSVATISGSTVTIVAAGTATITAAQAGNSNYNAASSVSQNLSVSQATLSSSLITAIAPASLVYSGSVKGYTASAGGVTAFGYTYVGVSPTVYASTTTAPKNVGTYSFTASSTDPNYAGSKTVNFTITPQPVTVTAAAKTKGYGSSDPTLTYASSGLLGTDAFTGSLTRAAGEAVGSYNILIGTLSAGSNYSVSYVGTSLVITANYLSWASSYGLSGNNALQSADPDNDGSNNAAEYAFGGNPMTSNQQIVSASPVLGGIKFVWLQRKVQGQVTYSPKTSTDLALSYSSWATVNSAESNPQPLGISTDYKQMEVVLPTSAGKGFLKIEASVQ
jgi:subtilisin family serine protease